VYCTLSAFKIDNIQGYIFWEFLSKLKNREEFEGGLYEKRKGKVGKRRKKKRK